MDNVDSVTSSYRALSARPAARVLLTLMAMGGALGLMNLATAADADGASSAQIQYEKERARCNSAYSGEERSTCLTSAGAALQEARAGHLDMVQHDYQQNRTDRCTPLPPAERDDCVRRMQGEGSVSGSVRGGGDIRELDTVTVTPAPSGGPPATAPADR